MLPSRFAVTFSCGYTAYWDAKTQDRAARYARPWVKVLGEIATVRVHVSGPHLR